MYIQILKTQLKYQQLNLITDSEKQKPMKIRSSHFKRQYDLSKAELIGEGNFAQVYRIFDSELNDSLAIRKVKKSEADMDDITKQKVINQELRKVENENILKIYDIIDTQQAVWYITQYCSGGSLWDVLNLCKDNKMNQKQCLQCVLQISKGVQQLHNHRITHRDLKPQNILLKTKYITNRPLPLVKLADFGLSTQKIIMQTIAGTKQYIAPEQAKFHNYTNAVDVWSLGIICDQILHGNPFYSGQNNKQVFNKILKLPYKVRDSTIRLSIQNLLTSLLKKKPYQRPIIAVIRKTIQKILQQIQLQLAVSKNEKQKKKQSKDQSFQSSTHSSNLNKYTNLLGIQSRKIQTKKVPQKKQSVQNSIYKKQHYVPNITNTNVVKTPRQYRQQPKRQISGKKIQTQPVLQKTRQIETIKSKQSKPQSPRSQKQLSQKSSKSTSRKPVRAVQDQKSEYKSETTVLENKSQSKNQAKNQHSMMTKQSQNIQIPVYKPMKKVIVPIKKQQVKAEHMDVAQYMSKLLQSKKQMQQVTCVIKIQKLPSFLPNTGFTSNQFTITSTKTVEPLTKFKKQYQILNYIQYNDEYDINVYRKQVELQKNKNICLNSFKQISEQLKQQFLKQVEYYVENYLEKVFK